MRKATRLGLLIALGAIAALVISSFLVSPEWPQVITEPAPLAGTDGVPRSVANVVPLEQAPQSTTESDPLAATASDHAGTTVSPPPDQPTTIESSVDVHAVTELASSDDESASESTSPGDELTERPLGWCFRTWSRPAGPWLAVSPPGQPTHELRSDSRAVLSGSRSAWLGTEDPPGQRFYADVMWQVIDATPYRGSRIGLSGQFREFQSVRWDVHLFLRTPRATEKEIVLLGAELLGAPPQNVLFHGGTDWVRFGVVGDVAVDAEVIVLGVAVYGGGHVSIDDVRLTTVPKSTPLTKSPQGGGPLILPLAPVQPFATPTNLDFEATNLDPTDQPLPPAGC